MKWRWFSFFFGGNLCNMALATFPPSRIYIHIQGQSEEFWRLQEWLVMWVSAIWRNMFTLHSRNLEKTLMTDSSYSFSWEWRKAAWVFCGSFLSDGNRIFCVKAWWMWCRMVRQDWYRKWSFLRLILKYHPVFDVPYLLPFLYKPQTYCIKLRSFTLKWWMDRSTKCMDEWDAINYSSVWKIMPHQESTRCIKFHRPCSVHTYEWPYWLLYHNLHTCEFVLFEQFVHVVPIVQCSINARKWIRVCEVQLPKDLST